MGVTHFLTFILTTLFFAMTPGIDTVFVLNKCIARGRKAAWFAAVGISAGVLVHTCFAALGLSLIVARSAMAFAMIKYLGAAYLIYLGVRKLVVRGALDLSGTTERMSYSDGQNFIAGLMTNVLNPKVALFVLAFFPQFIEPRALGTVAPYVLLGVSYSLLAVVWFSILIVFASLIARKIMGHSKTGPVMNKISGAVFVLMGIKIALTKK